MGTKVQPIRKETAGAAETPAKPQDDDFFKADDLFTFDRDAAERRSKQVLMEAVELMRDKKWEDLLAVLQPVDEKHPEVVRHGFDAELREKCAFALGQLQRFDDAVAELQICVARDPENFHAHSSLAYTAYNSLYAAKNKEIFLSGKVREERVALAHRHFQAAQALRPDGVTNFYREGMLFKQLENKPVKALPLFRRAVDNWDRLDAAEREARHQERKNYIKALYQLAAVCLERGDGGSALKLLKRCLKEDEQSGHLSLQFKYFALGKVHFHLGDFSQAKDALLFALQSDGSRPADFVCELLARTYLALKNVSRAREIVRKVPENRRRPYYRWTESDVCCAEGDLAGARRVLSACLERDRRSRHKTLVRLAKIEYLRGDFKAVVRCAGEAGRFFQEQWGRHHDDSLFWQALGSFRLGDTKTALELAEELRLINPGYPKLNLLLERLRGA